MLHCIKNRRFGGCRSKKVDVGGGAKHAALLVQVLHIAHAATIMSSAREANRVLSLGAEAVMAWRMITSALSMNR
jgi:hypothetical protein